MIVVLGSPEDAMIRRVSGELERRSARAVVVDPGHIPGTIRLDVRLPFMGGCFSWEDGRILDFGDIGAIYSRFGISDFQGAEGITEDQQFQVNLQCAGCLSPVLNELPALVINRPRANASNGSKPYQAGLIARMGFRVPDTLVTNEPDVAREFYELHRGQVIYKSISHIRSQVQLVLPEDLDRLDSLPNCPVQLQEFIPGTDVRVHVLGDHAVFPHRIQTATKDYRFDRNVEIRAALLPSEVAEACCDLARGLGLVMAGIDLRFTPDGEVVCFEVNPSPAYNYYEAHTGQPITSTLCDMLMAADGQKVPDSRSLPMAA
ncbi:MAG: glutathione synthase [Candidatus Eremiobacterota bacterium]